jgi:hypothetical protein
MFFFYRRFHIFSSVYFLATLGPVKEAPGSAGNAIAV